MTRAKVPEHGRQIVERKRTGEVKRRLTVYVSPDAYRGLRRYAADHDLDVSAAVAVAVDRLLVAEK